MIKKVIQFEDFDGNPVSEEHYFHLSKSELIEMELSEKDGMAAKLEKILNSGKGAEIIQLFKDIIASSYGQRDPSNPTKFTKYPEKREEFMGSLAFDALFGELLTSPVAAAEFVNGLIPKDLAESEGVKTAFDEAKAFPAGRPASIPEISPFDDDRSGLQNPRHDGNLLPWAFRAPTDFELRKMTQPQLLDAHRRMSSGWTPPEPVL